MFLYKQIAGNNISTRDCTSSFGNGRLFNPFFAKLLHQQQQTVAAAAAAGLREETPQTLKFSSLQRYSNR